MKSTKPSREIPNPASKVRDTCRLASEAARKTDAIEQTYNQQSHGNLNISLPTPQTTPEPKQNPFHKPKFTILKNPTTQKSKPSQCPPPAAATHPTPPSPPRLPTTTAKTSPPIAPRNKATPTPQDKHKPTPRARIWGSRSWRKGGSLIARGTSFWRVGLRVVVRGELGTLGVRMVRGWRRLLRRRGSEGRVLCDLSD